MGRVIDITRAGTNAVHVYIEVPRTDLLGRFLGLTRTEVYLGTERRWYLDGVGIMDARHDFLQSVRAKWNEGRYPPVLWD
jgi:hypothetical protein